MSAPSVGRPRDPAKDAAVLQAARDLLVDEGYHGTTVIAIARRAGVGAPTIYRRWATKEALIEDAAFGHPQSAPLPAPTGDLRTDLHAWVSQFLSFLADPVTRAALPGLLAAYHRDEGSYERLVLSSEDDVRTSFANVLSAARPPVRADAADTVFDFLVASTVARAMTRGLTASAAFCDRTADALTVLARA